MIIQKELIQKYNVPVPRYTSYPTANHFVELTNVNSGLNLISDSNSQTPTQIAIYIHIPFCAKICHYCGCNALPLGRGSKVKPYLDALKIEIIKVAEILDKSRIVSQIHYGGGTPNSVPSADIRSLNELIFSIFKVSEHAEIAIECNPAHLDYQYLDELIDAGFNRISLGIQDFDPNILRTVNRDVSKIPIADLMMYIREQSKTCSVNLDFIYGLPGQTVESFAHTISQAIILRPDRLVTFSYAHVPWAKKHQLVLEKYNLPDADTKTQMFLAGRKILTHAGYKQIGFDHFVLPSDDLYKSLESCELHRNFQGYCTRKTTGQVYAFGVSAISQLHKVFLQNTTNTDNYIQKITQDEFAYDKWLLISENQFVIGNVISDLMCNFKLNWSDSAAKIGSSVKHILNTIRFDKQELEAFSRDGLLNFDDKGLELTELGTFFVRIVAASLDPEYSQNPGTYSKGI